MKMKNLILISGPMGVGKSTVMAQLRQMLPNNVALDGDWCWMAEPFHVTDETKEMVMGNIHHLLNAFLRCSAYENVIFCWVMNKQKIADDVLRGLCLDGVTVHHYSLVATEGALRARLQRDIDEGKRREGCIEKSLSYLWDYAYLNSVKVEVTDRTAREAAHIIAAEVLYKARAIAECEGDVV